MYLIKTITILLAFTTFAAIRAENTAIESLNFQCNTSVRTDDYLNLNRRQYAKNILSFDAEMENFKQSYTKSLNGIDIQKQMVLDSIIQCEEYFNPLEVLSDFTKACVNKYRKMVPTVAATRTKIDNCVLVATNQLTNLVSAPSVTSRNLQNYYNSNFETAVTNCDKRFPSLILNRTVCLTEAVQAANAYTITYQKSFDTQMDTARCSGKANVKQALYCSYNVQNSTLSAITESKVLINRCTQRLDDVPMAYSCSEAYYMPKSEKNANSRTITNPLYGRHGYSENCLTMIYT